MIAAAEKILPLVPGWEDSTMGNIFAKLLEQRRFEGFYYEIWNRIYDVLSRLVSKNSGGKGVGFFKIVSGIAGDFPL